MPDGAQDKKEREKERRKKEESTNTFKKCVAYCVQEKSLLLAKDTSRQRRTSNLARSTQMPTHVRHASATPLAS
jgi:hypothetical protein